MQLDVFKYEGAGNDFVAIDDRSGRLPDGEEMANFARILCDRRRGIGADGVLVIQSPSTSSAQFRMRYYNADGSEGEMCGNGARCIARFANFVHAAGPEMAFDTAAGLYRATTSADGVDVAFPEVNVLPRPISVEANGRIFDADFNVVGVPHLVVWVDDLETIDVFGYGRALRHHSAFAPRGTNVNFAQADPAEPGTVRIRTYERGVEEETLACGTGSVASAMSHLVRSGASGPQRITVIPTSGDRLRILMDLHAGGARGVFLGGPARQVFATKIEWTAGDARIKPVSR